MKQKIQNKLRRAILAICAMMAMSVMTTAFSSCSSSDDDDEKANIEEYLAGREWGVGSTNGTYSYATSCEKAHLFRGGMIAGCQS